MFASADEQIFIAVDYEWFCTKLPKIADKYIKMTIQSLRYIDLDRKLTLYCFRE